MEQCANRLLVQSSVVEASTAKLVAKVNALKLGKGIVAGTTQEPLVNAVAVDKVIAHVGNALSQGGVLQTGGKVPDGLEGYSYEPTVITSATSEMEVAHDETFGPLAAIFAFKDGEEAIKMANDTDLGLAGYFSSKDVGRVFRVARALECGVVGVNTGLISAAETPFGGIKESGVGREGSNYGLAEYQTIKSVTIGNNQD
jgi:succinate-semialdehyde dehydrogenase/glutarate-semialdehyde dehydrogenase